MERVAEDATAFSGRGSRYLVNPEANWERPEDDEANVSWARECLAALEPHASGGVYLNFPGLLEEGDTNVRASPGPSYPPLANPKAPPTPNLRLPGGLRRPRPRPSGNLP